MFNGRSRGVYTLGFFCLSVWTFLRTCLFEDLTPPPPPIELRIPGSAPEFLFDEHLYSGKENTQPVKTGIKVVSWGKGIFTWVLSLSLSWGFTPCRHLKPSSGREHTIVYLIQSGDDDYLMNETRRKPTAGRQSPSRSDKWHGIFHICPVTQTRLDLPRPLITQSHRHGWTYTKAIDYPVT